MTESTIQISGCVTFWTIGEYTDRALLKAALDSAGFEKQVPEARTPLSALRDALGDIFKDQKYNIERLKDKTAFEVVEVIRGDRYNTYKQELTARIDPVSLQISFDPFDSRAHAITEHYNRHLGLIRPAQVSAALVDICQQLAGTRLRPTGAIYWLPEYNLTAWKRVAAAVESSGVGRNALYIIRHEMDQDAIRAVRDAIVAEVSADAKRIDEEVSAGTLGERGLENRRLQAESLRKKIGEYEDLLGCGLTDLRTAVDHAEQAAMKAAILASTAEAAVA